ncbi:butyrate kinase [bacterium]|nr:butyrate kinase [bacterium]
MSKPIHIFVINPGSTSTKLAYFKNQNMISEETIRHTDRELKACPSVMSQKEFRYKKITKFIHDHDIPVTELNAVVGRGGLIRPVESGTYLVDKQMIDELNDARFGEHASNLGAVMADMLAGNVPCPAYVVDPVVVDEMMPEARLSGHPLIQRKSIFHALNHKAAARQAARRLKKKDQDCRFVVAHLGGGISVAAHVHGRVIDVNNALDGDGPFSPERSGGLPCGDLARLCFSGKYPAADIRRMIVGQGGLKAYLGTHDLEMIENNIRNKDAVSIRTYNAMIYQISKEIGAMSASLRGHMDAIVLTGGMTHSSRLIRSLKKQIAWIAPVIVIPGECEMEALAMGAYRVLCGEEKVKGYERIE